MILLVVVALFVFGDCSGDGVGVYGEYKDLIDNLKKVGEYKKYDQLQYDSKIDTKDDKKGDQEHLEYRKYDAGYDNQDDKQYVDKKDDRNHRGGYGYDDDQKYDKYDGPKDYVVSDKFNDKYYNDGFDRKLGSDIREYDYVTKCDIQEKDCKDGKDCYDNAKDRSGYDKCRDTYGEEDRYYDENNRYTGERYHSDNDRDRYEKDCYEKSKNSGDYNKCLSGYDSRNYYDYDKDCYDNTKRREDYDKCRGYYRRCRDSYQRDYRYLYREDDWKNDKDCSYGDYNLVGLGRNDREDQLIRPCALDDRQCIRKYLARNSKCKPAYGPIPDPLYLKRNTVYLPYANVTLIQTRLRITGLSSIKIREFYVNKDTRNLVIALDFQNLNETSPRAFVRYKRTAKESIVLSDYATFEFTSGTFTAVIPKVPHLRLDLAEVHADIGLAPRFFLGPKAVESNDPDVVSSSAMLGANSPVRTQEYFLFQSQLLTAIYIQENLCDFGLKLISI